MSHTQATNFIRPQTQVGVLLSTGEGGQTPLPTSAHDLHYQQQKFVRLYVKYVKFYDQDKDNVVRNLVICVVKYALSPGRWLKGHIRVAQQMVDDDKETLMRLVYYNIIYRHYGKSMRMIKRLRKS